MYASTFWHEALNDLIQILNHLLLNFITFINEKSKELCANVIIIHVLKIDRVHRYWF